MPIKDDLLEILCCPETKKPLKMVPDEVVQEINEKVAASQVKYTSGSEVKDPLDEALVTVDGERIYVIRDSIPIMLVDECILSAQLGEEIAASGGMLLPGLYTNDLDASDMAARISRAAQRTDEAAARELREEIDAAVQILVNRHHVADGLAPRQFVRVVFVRTDEHHGTLVGGDLPGQAVLLVEVVRDPQIENADQAIDRAGGTRTGEDDRMIIRSPDRVADDPPRVLAKSGCLPTRPRALGVRIRIQRQNGLAQEILDHRQ